MQNIIFVVVLLLIGMALRRLSEVHRRHPDARDWLHMVPPTLAEGLTSFVIWVSLPALILVQIPKLALSTDLLIPVVMPWVMLLTSAGLVLLISRALGWHREHRDWEGLLLLLVPLGNTSFLGIPMVETFFGPEYIEYAVLYDQAGTFLALATYGAVIAAFYGTSTKRAPTAGRVLLRVIVFPPFVALLLAFALRTVTLPQAVTDLLEVLAATLIPLVIAAVGFKVELRMTRADQVPMWIGLGLKLVVAPLLAWGGCRLLGLDSMIAKVSIFEAGMPAQISAWAVAMEAGLAPRLGAAIVGLGIILSFVTLSGLYQLL